MRILILLLSFAAVLHAQIHPSLPQPGTLDGMGVNIHFTDPQPGELEMMKSAGFRWVRTDLTWVATERKRGVYDFSKHDRLIAALGKAGLRAYFILDYGNPLYAEPGDKHPFTSRAGTPEFRAAFAKWAVAAVSHFQGKGIVWELWNEPNNPNFWKPAPNVADYIALVKATASALEAAGLRAKSRTAKSPGECLVGPAASKIDLPFLDACFSAGLLEVFDGISVHPYRQGAPETAAADYRELRQLIRRHCPANALPLGTAEHTKVARRIPILSGEWGYSTVWMNHSEELQGKYLPRMFLTNVANDIPLSIWYDWRDDGDDNHEPEHRFGIVRRKPTGDKKQPFEPKPAYHAAKALSASPLHISKELRLPDELPPKPLAKKREREIPDFLSKSEVVADGERTVASRQVLSVGQPNDGPCPRLTESLHIEYQFAAGAKFARIQLPEAARKIEGTPKTFSIWLHGDGQGGTPAIRFRDATGQFFQARGEPITWKGWRHLTFPFTPDEGSEQTLIPLPESGAPQRIKWGHWGGANDGKVNGAISWDSIFLLDGNKRAMEGHIFLSAPALIY